MEFQSNEELYFSWWLNDLKERGIIVRYLYESNTFTLSQSKWYPFIKKMVTKTKLEQKSFLEEHVYTPDFLVEWNEEWDGIMFREILAEKYSTKPPFFCVRSKKDNKPYTFFEVKPAYDQNNMTRLFRITQKWLYDKYGLYVDLVVVPKIFDKTFVPSRYMFTDKSMKPRTINFGIKTLDEYINWLKGNNLKQLEINANQT